MNTNTIKQSLVAAVAGLALIPLAYGLALAEQKDEKAIADQLRQYEAHFNRGDAEAMAKLFDEDVIYYDPLGQVHKGRKAVQQYYQRSMAAGFSDMKVEKVKIEVFDDTAYDVARYTITSPAGQPLSGYHLAILAKEDGEWIVQRTLVNVAMPKPPGGQGNRQ